MAYTFRDTTAGSTGTTSRAAEAVKFNGIWLDAVVPGFTVLNVTGREAAPAEITDQDIADYTYYLSKKYPPRTIRVKYQILSTSNSNYRDAFNFLNYYLRPEQAQLIFHDEEDKYFIATKASNDEVEEGRNNVIGVINFYCVDPLKYAINTKSFTANSSGKIEIVNSGTMPVDIDYDVTMDSDNGYVGFTTGAASLEYGLKEAVDSVKASQSQMLLSLKTGTAMLSAGEYAANRSDLANAGTFVNGSLYNVANWLKPSSFGSGTGWHGPALRIPLPADRNGDYGASDFQCWADLLFETDTLQALGLMAIGVNDVNGNLVAGMHLIKGYQNAWEMRVWQRVMGKDQHYIMYLTPQVGRDINAYNHVSFPNGNVLSIQKKGNLWTFNVAGTIWSIKDTSVADIRSVTLQSCQSGSAATAEVMGWKDLYFRKDFSSVVPNRYSSGDVMHVDGSETLMTLNGRPQMGDEIIGSSYFKADRGNTNVNVAFSDWYQGSVNATATIREAWL